MTELSTGMLVRKYAVRAALLGGMCVLAVYFMNLIFDIRIRELRSSLKSLNNNQTSFRTLALISRYQLIRDRMGKSDEANQFRNEGKTMLALNQTTALDEGDRATRIDRLGIGLINALNWLTGVESLKNYQGSPDQRMLELAYLYELRRDYVRAIDTYNAALRMLPEENQQAIQYAYLHRGFCLSLIDKKNEALADYSIVIATNQTGEFRYTAEILSALLRDLLQKTEKIDQMNDSEGKAEAYYKLAAYPKAVVVYERLQKKGKLSARGTYFSGRAHEELGQTDKAAEKFRSLVATAPTDAWTKRANRRIYALGAFYGGDKKFREESQKNATTVVKDTELLKTAEKFESVIQKNEETVLARQEEFHETEAIVQKEKQENVDKPVVVEKTVVPTKTTPAQVPIKKIAKAPPILKPPSQKDVILKQQLPETPEEKLKSALRKDNLTRVEKKEILMTFKEIEQITLLDDNKIWGILIGEDKERLSFFTVMGKIKIAKSRIKSREKVGRDEAFH
ncbi:MAG: hypothetical protein LDLANPLL_01690 [Turneriella sp.]|nr:hypothetical protein [Turneriella sp.]